MPYTPEQIEELLIEATLHKFFGDSLNAQQRTVAADILREVSYPVITEALPFETWQTRVHTLQQYWEQQPAATSEDQQLVYFARLWLQLVAAATMQQFFPKYSKNYYEEAVHLAAQIATEATDAAVKNLILKIYSDAGAMQGKLGNSAEELKYCEQGLNHAHHRLAELTPDAKATVLDLYLNAGVAQGQQGNFAEALKYFEQGLSHAHDWLAELTLVAKATVLNLYRNAGFTQEQLGNSAEELKYYEQGLSHAHDWLAELTPAAKATVLALYDNYSSIYYNSRQIAQVISLLPDQGLWSWVGFKHSDFKENILRNWQNNLNIQYSPAQLIAAFQQCFYALLSRDHDPTQATRPFGFITTETLLQLSETLYALDQARDNAHLQTVYQALHRLSEQEVVTRAQHLHAQLKQLAEQPISWWWQWWHSWQRADLEQKLAYLSSHTGDALEWQQCNREVETALTDWLLGNCRTHFSFADQLTEFPYIILAMLLLGETAESVTAAVHTWHTAPPWLNHDTLQAALSKTHYQQWLDEEKRPLSFWKSLLHSNFSHHLRIDFKIANQPQPELQTWLRQPEQLLEKLAATWQQLQRTARPLARLLAAFDTIDFQETSIEAVIDATTPNLTHADAALATVILGDITQQLESAIRHWLQLTPLSKDLLATVTAQQHRFTRAVAIYDKTHHAVLAQQVHDWSKARLHEILQNEAEDFTEIWALLERNRVGLHSLATHLPENWETDLSQLLWKDLELMVRQLADGYEPKDNEMWQPLQRWIDYFEAHLRTARVLDWKQCQMRLRPGEALLQPFFDENQQILRLLWLDRKTLLLLDMPKNCAPAAEWDAFVETWESALDDKNTDRITPLLQDSIFAHAARYLAETASYYQITQLTVIFPAPLGQLPWEALPALENILVREISVNHWYQNQPVTQTGAWVLGMGNVTTELGCCNTEARWVAECWNTTATCPDQPLETFEVLQKLATQRHLFLSTHAGFNLHDPLASGLSLGQHKTSDKIGVDLPLWLCSAIATPCELLVLSACQSNLTGKQTQGILSPVGIAPSFAAAGARTVIGTLWQVKDLTSLCFHYHLFTLAKTRPELPWHQLMALARQRLREMTADELKQLRTQLKINNDQAHTVKCFAATADFIAHAKRKKCLPFAHPREWAAFTVCGAMTKQRE